MKRLALLAALLLFAPGALAARNELHL